MKKRIIFAVIAIPSMFFILFLLPVQFLGAVVGLISSAAAYEFISAISPGIKIRRKIYAMISAAVIPVLESVGYGRLAAFVCIFFLFFFVFIDVIISYERGNGESAGDAAAAVFSGTVIPVVFSTVIVLQEAGPFYTLLPFIMTVICDSGAFFIGTAFGKRKLAPRVSPNKSVEGAVGGLVFTVIAVAIYGFVLAYSGYKVNFPYLIVYGVVGAVTSQIGDLIFSVVKRLSGIKDFGEIIPGSGGMLDRFDSLFLTAPAMALLLHFIPAFTK